MIPIYIILSIYLIGTLLSVIPSNIFFFKVWNYFRPQLAFIAGVLAINLLVALFIQPTVLRGSLFGLTVLSIALHLWKIRHHLPFFSKELPGVRAADHAISMISLNVRQENRDTQKLIQLVRDQKPDILLLTEIDDQWAKELEELKDHFEHRITECRQDTYGMGIYSTLPIESCEKQYYCESEIPALNLLLKDKTGVSFRILGIHPQPPGEELTGDCFEEYLKNTLHVAKETDDPIIIAGDFNEVCWSDQMDNLKQTCKLKDPRVGRGFIPTYNTHIPFFRFPIDHVLFCGSLELVNIKRLPSVGSDHFPLQVTYQLVQQKNTKPAKRKETLPKRIKSTTPSTLISEHKTIET